MTLRWQLITPRVQLITLQRFESYTGTEHVAVQSKDGSEHLAVQSMIMQRVRACDRVGIVN